MGQKSSQYGNLIQCIYGGLYSAVIFYGSLLVNAKWSRPSEIQLKLLFSYGVLYNSSIEWPAANPVLINIHTHIVNITPPMAVKVDQGF